MAQSSLDSFTTGKHHYLITYLIIV